MTISVLVIDDSATMRALLTARLESEPDIRVIGAARDAAEGREMIRSLDPDVVTLDIEMPGMTGLDFLEKIMALRPTPVIIVSGISREGTRETARALALGAVGCHAKEGLAGLGDGAALAALVREAALVRFPVRHRRAAPPAPATRNRNASVGKCKAALIAIGASTGGVEALQATLSAFPEDGPPVLVVQHINASFAGSVAQTLDRHCPPRVILASDGMPLERGMVYIAPGNLEHMLYLPGTPPRIRLRRGDPVSGHRPSVDALFMSVAQGVGADAVGVLLTGMGEDGARGLLMMREAGAFTIAQDQESCVVFGMPRAAIAMGAATAVAPLGAIADIAHGRIAA